MDIEVKNLHPLEVRLLRHVDLGQDITAQRLVDELDYKIGQCNQAFSWLTSPRPVPSRPSPDCPSR